MQRVPATIDLPILPNSPFSFRQVGLKVFLQSAAELVKKQEGEESRPQEAALSQAI